jgi:hypothetical protein
MSRTKNIKKIKAMKMSSVFITDIISLLNGFEIIGMIRLKNQKTNPT